MRVSVASVRTPPELGASVAGWVLRAALVAVALALAAVQFHSGFLLGVTVLLLALAAFRPRTMMAWLFLALIGASVLWQPPEQEWRFAVVLLGMHLMHLLSAWCLHVPAAALVQLRVFVRPLARLVAIQVVVQAVALAVRAFHGTSAASVPVLGIVAAAALVVLALVLVAPIVRRPR